MSSSVIAGVNVEEISKHLNCSICDRLIRSPKLLPCLHSFCQQCLEDLANANEGFLCPQCKTEIRIPKEEIENLPNNFFLDNMLDIALINSSDSEPVPCTNCDLNATANSRCIDCGEFLCGDCYNVHKRIRQTKEHRILTITELLSSTTGEVLHRLAYCKNHKTEQLNYFCGTCNEAVCRDCLIIEHRQHKYDYISESKKIQKHKDGLKSLLEETLPRIKTIEQANADIRSFRDALHGRLGTVKSEIRVMTTELIQVLKEREKQLLSKADQMFKFKNSIIEDQQNELCLENIKFKTACDFTAQVLKHANEVELLLLKDPIKNRLTELNKAELNTIPRERGNMRYDVDRIEADRAVEQALGKVKSYGEIKIDENINEIVSQKDGVQEKGERIPGATKPPQKDCISVEVKDSIGVAISQDNLPQDQKQSRATFTPRVKGVYSINVYSCGKLVGDLQIDFKNSNPEDSTTDKPSDPVPRQRSAKQSFAGSDGKFGKLSDPQDVAVDNKGHVIVSDSRNHRIQVFDINGKFLCRFGKLGTREGLLQSPNGLAVNKDGNIVVSDMLNNRMQVFTLDGEYVKGFGGQGNDHLHHPSGVAVDKEGRIIVVDRGNARVVIYDDDGNLVTSFGSLGNGRGNFNSPSHVAVNSKGHIIVSDFGNDRIQVFSSSGTFMFRFGESGREDGKFNWPTGVAVNQSDQIIVSDSYNHRMQVFQPDGTFLSRFGSEGGREGEFKRPGGVAVTNTGNIVVADWGNDRIQVF
ncbi:E3 ubiquitin-protein ligase TRIM71-like isoform X2 [Actinia tenebrosa]|uniref:E3 ubiquitin-protein ligase TRIM71-like isoform X2 n=1 Tax=Actinia tenebrosa TaxID=6105 RepID=A0A6P8IFJ2_ACTTE|nr:E3 ubiquitin-protein ligase TRIM71-like isoform X2 [Actinia tenebrosa]